MAERLAVEDVPVDSLAEFPGNPRRGDVDAVARSLERFDQYRPIVVNARTKQILAGNHTWKAARQLGWTTIAVQWVDADDAEAKAIVLADNRTSDLGTYDDADLAAMLAEIEAADASLLEAASYSAEDLQALLDGIDGDLPAPNAGGELPARDPSPWVPDPPAPRSEPVTVRVLQGDSRDVLADMDEASIDSIVTDPPYGLEFMGKDWDSFRVDERSARWAGNERTGGAGAGFAEPGDSPYDGRPAYGRRRTTSECRVVPVDPVPIEMRAFQNWCYQWAVEAYRVLKPGGHLVAFGGSRTYHRLAAALEDAGFDIRDSLHWMYGSGFPKSLDVSKQIDKGAGVWRGKAGEVASGNGAMAGPNYERTPKGEPATAEAAEWDGWGTALKPSHEPIVLARKPLDGTVAANVQKWGTGALNIDACRVPTDEEYVTEGGEPFDGRHLAGYGHGLGVANPQHENGRWPANVLLSHAASCTPEVCEPACPIATLDTQSGTTRSAAGTVAYSQPASAATPSGADGGVSAANRRTVDVEGYGDEGGASRFFTQTAWGGEDAGMPVMVYVPKPSTAERNAGLDALPVRPVNESLEEGDLGLNSPRAGAQANFHPTVKPVALMRWLIRLVTPPGGTVLEPFTGSGSTLVAAVLEGFDSVGVELTGDYLPIIDARVAWAQAQCPLGTSEP